jgi:hypothetical protein
LNEFLLAMKKAGFVGEELNALALLVVAESRLLPRPLNLFVKGHSSAGKNWLVTRLFRLMPKSAVAEISSASDKAWNYSQSDFRHRVVYAGLQHARNQGKKLGRPSLRELTPSEIGKLKNERKREQIPFRELAKRYRISVFTAHKLCGGRRDQQLQ